MEGHERHDVVVEEREALGHGERKRRDRDRDESGHGRRRRGVKARVRVGALTRASASWRESESGVEGARRKPELAPITAASSDRRKKRIEEKEKQSSTIFVGDLDPDTTAEQLTGLLCKFGSVICSKIKENLCYEFVTFEKWEAAETAIATRQIPLALS